MLELGNIGEGASSQPARRGRGGGESLYSTPKCNLELLRLP